MMYVYPILEAPKDLYRIRQGKEGRYLIELSTDGGKWWSVQCMAPDRFIAESILRGYMKNSKKPCEILL